MKARRVASGPRPGSVTGREFVPGRPRDVLGSSGRGGLGAPLGRAANSTPPRASDATQADGHDANKAPSERARTTDHLAALLMNGLRRLMGQGQRKCRIQRTSPEVALTRYRSGDGQRSRLNIEGVSTCKSPLCPLCVRKWQRTRCAEIKQALDYWEAQGPGRVLFFTGTMKHHGGMPLALMHRLQTRAYGTMWSGRKGQALKDMFDGKPESIRAHDRTCSFEHGWHPHIHALMFLQGKTYSVDVLQLLLDHRWRESLSGALRSYNRFVDRLLRGDPCRTHKRFRRRLRQGRIIDDSCSACIFGTGECLNQRDRAKAVFGSKLIHRNMKLRDALTRVAAMLGEFSEEAITPSREHGVRLEWVDRDKEKVSSYLTKLGAMGFELASSTSKLGHIDERKIIHYSPWELAQIAITWGHDHRKRAQQLWSDLFASTYATQTITFSNRRRLGLGDDPYANGQEPEELDEDKGETKELVGTIDGETFDGMVQLHKHGLLVTLQSAEAIGVVADLPFVTRPPDKYEHSKGWHGVPTTKNPTERGPPITPDERERLWNAQRDAAVEKGRQAWSALSKAIAEQEEYVTHDGRKALRRPAREMEFLEEVRERLEEMNASRAKGKHLHVLLEELASR